MSRIGHAPIELPSGVTVEIEREHLLVKGPKGQVQTPIPEQIGFEMRDEDLVATRDSEDKPVRALHGLARALAANAVHGVTEGYRRELEIQGIGYRAAMQGKTLTMQLGFSHPVEYPSPDGIDISVPSPEKIIIEGVDKQKVGETAAQIRRIRPPDAYKGKGIRYSDEVVHTKVGKAGVATTPTA